MLQQESSSPPPAGSASPLSSAKKGKQKLRSKFIQGSPNGNTSTLDTKTSAADSPFIKGRNTNAKKLIQNVTEKVDEVDTMNTPRKTIKSLTSYPESPSATSISTISVTPLSISNVSQSDTSSLGAASPLLSSTPQASTVKKELPLDNATPEDAVKKLKELASQMQQKQKELEQAEFKLNQVITNYEQQQNKQTEIKDTLDKVYYKLEQDKLIQTLTEAEPKDEAIQKLQVQVQDFETKLHTRMNRVVEPSKGPSLVFLGGVFLLTSLIIYVLLNIISNAIASKQGGILRPS